MENYSVFLSLMDEMTDFFNDYSKLMDRKLKYVQENNTSELEGLMNEEQAYLLRIKGYDKKREKLVVQMFNKNLSFKEIIDNSENKEVLNEAYDKLNEAVVNFENVSATTNKFIELNIHSIDVLLSRIDYNNKAQKDGAYNKQGKKNDNANLSFKSTKI